MARRRKKNPFKPFIDKLPAWVKNKYIITIIVFFVVLFVSNVNPFTQFSLQNTKKEREVKKDYYEGKLEGVKSDKIDNVKNVEKFARENYYMKKRDEDVFIIVEENSEKE